MPLADILGDPSQPFDDIPRAIVELRLAAIVCRDGDAARLYPGEASDFSAPQANAIMTAAMKAVRDRVPGGPTIANISSLSGIAEAELRGLAYAASVDLVADFETYAARVQAEAFLEAQRRAIEDGYARLGRATWREAETIAALVKRQVAEVQMARSLTGQNDIGNALDLIGTDDKDNRQIRFPYKWFNDMTEGGLRSAQKMYIAGPEGSRKSTMLYNIELFWAMRGEHVVHFIFDGGTKTAQAAKICTIRWRQLCEQHRQSQRNPDGVTDFELSCINKTTTWMVKANKEHELPFSISPLMRELFWSAYQEMRDISYGGKGPGRLTFVEPGEVHSNFNLMRQRLQRELYDGMTVWCFDNMTKGFGTPSAKGIERTTELVQILHTFTDESHIPCLILAHMNKDAIKDINSQRSGFIMFGSPIEQDCDFEYISRYNQETPGALSIFLPKNREEASGHNVKTVLQIEPRSGLIHE